MIDSGLVARAKRGHEEYKAVQGALHGAVEIALASKIANMGVLGQVRAEVEDYRSRGGKLDTLGRELGLPNKGRDFFCEDLEGKSRRKEHKMTPARQALVDAIVLAVGRKELWDLCKAIVAEDEQAAAKEVQVPADIPEHLRAAYLELEALKKGTAGVAVAPNAATATVATRELGDDGELGNTMLGYGDMEPHYVRMGVRDDVVLNSKGVENPNVPERRRAIRAAVAKAFGGVKPPRSQDPNTSERVRDPFSSLNGLRWDKVQEWGRIERGGEVLLYVLREASAFGDKIAFHAGEGWAEHGRNWLEYSNRAVEWFQEISEAAGYDVLWSKQRSVDGVGLIGCVREDFGDEKNGVEPYRADGWEMGRLAREFFIGEEVDVWASLARDGRSLANGVIHLSGDIKAPRQDRRYQLAAIDDELRRLMGMGKRAQRFIIRDGILVREGASLEEAYERIHGVRIGQEPAPYERHDVMGVDEWVRIETAKLRAREAEEAAAREAAAAVVEDPDGAGALFAELAARVDADDAVEAERMRANQRALAEEYYAGQDDAE